jgi:hypothetical protein
MSNRNNKRNQVATGASLQELEIDLPNNTFLESQEVKMEISDNNKRGWKGEERRSGEDRRRFAYRSGNQDKRSGRDRRRKKSK